MVVKIIWSTTFTLNTTSDCNGIFYLMSTLGRDQTVFAHRSTSACTKFLKQEVMTSTHRFGSHRPNLWKSNYAHGAKNVTLIFKHDVVCNA